MFKRIVLQTQSSPREPLDYFSYIYDKVFIEQVEVHAAYIEIVENKSPARHRKHNVRLNLRVK